jgi:hypothetical protein
MDEKLKSWTCTKNETMKKCSDWFTWGGHLVKSLGSMWFLGVS